MAAIDNGSCAALEIPNLNPHQTTVETLQQLSVENQSGKNGPCVRSKAADTTGSTGQANPHDLDLKNPYPENAHPGSKPIVPHKGTPEEDAAFWILNRYMVRRRTEMG